MQWPLLNNLPINHIPNVGFQFLHKENIVPLMSVTNKGIRTGEQPNLFLGQN